MKEVKLNDQPTVCITDEGYEALLTLIKTYSVCRKCKRLYTEANPKVALNQCLECFLKQNPSLRYIKIASDENSSEEISLFLDPNGYIEYIPRHSHEQPWLHRSITRTLEYWGFPLPPKTISIQGRAVKVEEYWRIFGDIQTANVLVLYYEHFDGTSLEKPHLMVAYLTYKDGRFMLVNEHQEDMQAMFEKAREKLEATKDDRGNYRPKNLENGTGIDITQHLS
jgi:hypothetical protein